MSSGCYDRLVAVEIVLAAVRRETLLFTLALQRSGADAMKGAAGRLRSTIGAAQQLVAALPLDRCTDRTHQAFKLVMGRAERLLRDAPSTDLVRDVTVAVQTISDPEVYAQHADLVQLDLDDLDLSRMWAYGCAFTRVSARRSVLEVAEFASARFAHCDLSDSCFLSATFDDAMFADCDLSRADLKRSSWRRVTAARCKLTQAVLVGGRLDGAVFTDCDLRGVDFAVKKATPFATMRYTRFLRCDLRETNWRRRELIGVTFQDCKMFGAYGTPSLNDVFIERPDISILGDGSQIGMTGDVIASWSRP